ncbi:MAG: hypothetical protein S0880_11395 [Actinomycetota bacterium]|nr:hypothetical protein [Actinomycetota bacterium]
MDLFPPLVEALAFAAAVVGGLVAYGLKSVTDRDLVIFAERFGVEPGTDERPLVVARLRRARRVRSFTAAAAFAVSTIPTWLSHLVPDAASALNGRLDPWANPLVALALGVLVGEVLIRQRPTMRRAVVERRDPGRYVSIHLVRLLDVLALATPLAAVLAATRGEGGAASDPVATAAFGVGAWALARFGLWSIVQRPRLAPDGGMRAVDDALRADGAHHLVGVTLAVSAGAVGDLLWSVTWDGPAYVSLPLAAVGVAAYATWWQLANRSRWPVAPVADRGR